MSKTITRESFPAFIADIFERASSRLEDGWDRDMLLREFTDQELAAVLHMHEQGYGPKGEHVDGFEPGIAFWLDLYDWWLEYDPGETIVEQPVPAPGMWVQRPGDQPTRVVQYHPAGTFRIMPGDEKLAWLTTEDGATSAEGSYRVLGYRDGEG